MNRIQYFFESETVSHCGDEFSDEITRMRANNANAKNFVVTWWGQNFDEAFGFIVSDRPVEIINVVARYLVFNALGICLFFAETDAGHFRVCKYCPRQHGIVHPKFSHRAKQRIHGAIPPLVGCGMSELERTGNIATGEHVRVTGL